MVTYDDKNPPATFRRAKSYSSKSYDEIKIEKVSKQLIHSKKINNYIPLEWDFYKKQIQDKITTTNTKFTIPGMIIKSALSDNTDLLSLLHSRIDKCCYIIRENASTKTVIFFYGTEEKAFVKVMEKKASFYSNIPHIINGRICGDVKLSEIVRTTINYDREYGIYLKKLYDAGNINKQNFLN
jgi:hypothetical protein